MHNLKRKFNVYMYFQSELTKNHLETMALKGYKFKKNDKFTKLYEEIPPTSIKYDICYSNEAPILKDWDFIDSYHDMHIFSSEKEDVLPITNNEELKFELINKTMKSKVIPIYVLLFLFTLTQFCYQVHYTLSLPLEALGSNSPLFILGLLLLSISTLIPLFSYTIWYDKSKVLLKKSGNCFCSRIKFNKVVVLFAIGIIIIAISTFTISNNSNPNQTIIKTILYENDLARDVELSQDDIPVTLQMLGFEDNDYYSYYNSYNIESLFVKYNQSHQSKLHVATEEELDDLLHFDYNIIEVKFTPSFNLILNALLESIKNTSNYTVKQLDYYNVDGFYQMFKDDVETGVYVLTHGNKIVMFEFYAYTPSDELLDLTIQTFFSL